MVRASSDFWHDETISNRCITAYCTVSKWIPFGSCSSTLQDILSISLRPSPWSPSHSGATPFTMYRVSTEWFVQPAIWYWCTVPSTLNNSTCIRAYHLGTSMHTNISPTSTQSRPFSLNNKRLSRNHSWVLDVFSLVSDTGAIIYIYIHTWFYMGWASVLHGVTYG